MPAAFRALGPITVNSSSDFFIATVTIPSAAVVGDLLLLVLTSYNHTNNDPAGWDYVTEVTSSWNTPSDAPLTQKVYRRFCQPGDPGSSFQVKYNNGFDTGQYTYVVAYSGVSSGAVKAIQNAATDNSTQNAPLSVAGNSFTRRGLPVQIAANFQRNGAKGVDIDGENDRIVSFGGNVLVQIALSDDNLRAGSSPGHTVRNPNNGGFDKFVLTNLVLDSNDPPTTPGAFSAPASGQLVSSTVTATWGASSDPDGDTITYGLDYSRDGSTWTRVYTGTSTSATVDLSGQSATTTGRFRVHANDGYTTSGFSTSSNFTVNRPPGTAGAFTSPASGSVHNQSVTATWGAASDPDGQTLTYHLDLTRDNGTTWTNVATTTATSVSVNIASVVATTAARFRVRAFDGIQFAAAFRESATFTIQHNQDPTAPTGLSPSGNVSLNRQQAQRFTWTHNDPDGDAQARYELDYRIVGAAAFTTVTATSTGQFRDFAANAFTAGSYEWRVRTADQSVLSPSSALAYFQANDPPNSPTILTPANNGVVSQSSGFLQWSYPAQEAYRIRKLGDSAGSPNTADVLFDSGEIVSSTVRSASLSFPVNNRFEHVQVQVRDKGLWSVYSSVRVQVSYTQPPKSRITLKTNAQQGHIAAEVITYMPGLGEQPVASIELWRRDQGSGGDGIRIALLNPTQTYLDVTVEHRKEYEYRITTIGTNGTSVVGDWTDGVPPLPKASLTPTFTT